MKKKICFVLIAVSMVFIFTGFASAEPKTLSLYKWEGVVYRFEYTEDSAGSSFLRISLEPYLEDNGNHYYDAVRDASEDLRNELARIVSDARSSKSKRKVYTHKDVSAVILQRDGYMTISLADAYIDGKSVLEDVRSLVY